ncbi:MAG: thermonuclease family protein [Alphaproteobacteria bacterium]
MQRILILFFLLANIFMHPAFAEESPRLPQGDFSELKQTGLATVTAIIDPQTVQLEDGHIVRLAGLDFPDLNPNEPGEFSLISMKILRDMLEGKPVILYQTTNRDEGRINRMGQDIAHLQRQSDKAWVQGALLSLGLARVRTMQRNPEMAQQMYDLEQAAMKEKQGIWEKFTRVLTPEETPDHIGSFQIVEGQIKSASIKQNRIYLNFGNDWRTDFTVSIAPEDKRAFSKKKLDPLQWNGQKVRVRGLLDDYNGPYIEINHPAAIEIAVETSSPAPSQLPSSSKLPIVEKDVH